MATRTSERKWYLCGHCNEFLSKTLYHKHKQLYYHQTSKRWCAERVIDSTSEDFTFDDNTSNDDAGVLGTFEDSLLFETDKEVTESLETATDLVMEYNETGSLFETQSSGSSSDDDSSDELELFTEQAEDTSSNASETTTEAETKAIQIYLFFLMMFQTLFRSSDRALQVLLSFFAMFLRMLGKVFQCEKLETFAAKLPQTIGRARVATGSQRDNFRKYVCCPKCFSLYTWDEKVEHVSHTCTHIMFPNHPQVQHRQPCGRKLFKKVKTSSGKVLLQPILVYCYKSVIESLQEMLLHPSFLEQCEAWRKREAVPGEYHDIYDGEIWKDFQLFDGKPFLSVPFNFAFQLIIDWFQPFIHTQHSEGVMYMSVMNLPRSLRFLQENTILIGVIPGPKEPKKNINSLLQPMVNDLIQLWEGVVHNYKQSPVLVRAALLCSGCDIPAARKTCGFVGHAARKGCSKCLLDFPTEKFGEKPDYSNFNTEEWIQRTNLEHRKQASKHRVASTLSMQREVERESGVRYSVLLQLPYFDAPRMCIIDPMHNLFLGTAKRMIGIWKDDENVLSSSKFTDIQESVNSFVTPKGLGRLPFKIESGFSGFTAEQWKNWTLYFSLRGALPRRHFQCWQLFVKACSFLCRRKATVGEIDQANTLFEEFCKQFVTLYGNRYCTMNLHLHCHLSDCVKDYGPVYAFWLFAYERFNGIMGSYHTNCRNISVQLTRRFLDSKAYAPRKWPAEFVIEFLPLLDHFRYQQGSLMQDTIETTLISSKQTITPLVPVRECVWNPEEIEVLKHLIRTVWSPRGCR